MAWTVEYRLSHPSCWEGVEPGGPFADLLVLAALPVARSCKSLMAFLRSPLHRRQMESTSEAGIDACSFLAISVSRFDTFFSGIGLNSMHSTRGECKSSREKVRSRMSAASFRSAMSLKTRTKGDAVLCSRWRAMARRNSISASPFLNAGRDSSRMRARRPAPPDDDEEDEDDEDMEEEEDDEEPAEAADLAELTRFSPE
mmetsp:Transcript_10015/g.28485  ORF Transcript_10015/g.28485 Transcript_10015/m.28485 type:complete len:200 (-) Transcript_10015:737-1336(-)